MPALLPPPPPAKDDTIHFFGYDLNPASLGKVNDNYVGAFSPANTTFPWLAWNNRPYVSSYELMHVPKFSSRDLLKTWYDHTFTPPPPASPGVTVRNFSLPTGGTVLVSVRAEDRVAIEEPVRELASPGFRVIATPGTAAHLSELELAAESGP